MELLQLMEGRPLLGWELVEQARGCWLSTDSEADVGQKVLLAQSCWA